MCTLGPMVREVRAKRQVGQVGVWEALRQFQNKVLPRDSWSTPGILSETCHLKRQMGALRCRTGNMCLT